MKKSLPLAIFLTLALFFGPSLSGATPPGSFQWVPILYRDLPSATAGLAAGASDHLPPILIETSDPLIPFVVFRSLFVDLCLCALPHLTFFAGDEGRALKLFKDWRSSTTRKAGLVTTGNGAAAVAWFTHD